MTNVYPKGNCFNEGFRFFSIPFGCHGKLGTLDFGVTGSLLYFISQL